MTTLENRLSQLEVALFTTNIRTLTDAERVVRITVMLASDAPGCERVRELLARCTVNQTPTKME